MVCTGSPLCKDLEHAVALFLAGSMSDAHWVRQNAEWFGLPRDVVEEALSVGDDAKWFGGQMPRCVC